MKNAKLIQSWIDTHANVCRGMDDSTKSQLEDQIESVVAAFDLAHANMWAVRLKNKNSDRTSDG